MPRITKFPARIHVLLAREARSGLVIRRGPAQLTCLLSWDRMTDHFAVSQWFRGRIYERRSDLSPDGTHFIYFARNGKWKSRAKGAWTAISRAPWLKAVTLLAKGDCWHGGGLFLPSSEYWLNDGYGHAVLEDSGEVTRNTAYQPPYYNAEDLTVYYNRLQRDGWILKERSGPKLDMVAVFEKEMANGWLLRKIAHEQSGPPRGRGCYWDEHVLIGSEGESIPQPDWEWAEWIDGRLIWAEQGCLLTAPVESADKIGEAAMLHDFNGYTFERRAAPY